MIADLQALNNGPIDIQIKTFVQLKAKRTQLEELKKELDEKYYAIRLDLLKAMTEKRVLTLKTEAYTIVRTSRRVVAIEEPTKALNYFEKLGIKLPQKIDYYGALPTLNASLHNGKKIPGVTEKAAEYVSVKLNKKAEA